jgi:hypothetical protein
VSGEADPARAAPPRAPPLLRARTWLTGSPGGEAVVAGAFYLVCAIALFGAAVLPGHSILRTDYLLGRDPLFYDPARFADLARSRIGDIWGVNGQFQNALFAARALHHGQLPLWNPFVGMGQPFATMQGAGPNPLFLPFWLVPCEYTYTLGLILTLPVAALTAHLMARRLGASVGAAVVAGAGYGFTGAIVGWHTWFNSSNCAMLAVGGLAIEWLLARPDGETRLPRWRKRVFLALALACGLLVGHPTIGPIDTAALAVYAFLRVLEELPQRGLRAQLKILLELAGSGLAAAVAALPAWGWFLSFLHRGWSYKLQPSGLDIVKKSLLEDPPRTWASLLSPRVEADAMSVIHVAPRHVSPYLGLALVPLAATGIVYGLVRRKPGFLALPALVLIGLGIAYDVPHLNALRPAQVYNYYFFHLVAFPAALAGALGATLLARWARARYGFVVGLGLLAAGGGWLFYEVKKVRDTAYPTLAAWLAPGHTRDVLKHDAKGVFAFAAACVLAAAVPFLRRRLGVLLGVALAFDLVWTNHNVIERGVALGPPTSEALSFLQGVAGPGGNARLSGQNATAPIPNVGMMVGLYDVRVCESLVESRYADFIHALGPGADRMTFFITPNPSSPLLSLAAVRWVTLPKERWDFSTVTYPPVDPPPAPPTRGPLKRVVEDRYLAVYENPAAAPRAYLAGTWQPMHDENGALAVLSRNALKATGFITAPLVEPVPTGPGSGTATASAGAPVQPPPHVAPPAPQDSSGQRVTWTDDGLSHLALEVTTAAPALLVVTDSYDPGWRAWIDGTPAPIYPANVAFRGVFVPAGTHTVEMTYSPPGGRLLQALPVIVGLFGVVFLLLPAAWLRAIATWLTRQVGRLRRRLRRSSVATSPTS